MASRKGDAVLVWTKLVSRRPRSESEGRTLRDLYFSSKEPGVYPQSPSRHRLVPVPESRVVDAKILNLVGRLAFEHVVVRASVLLLVEPDLPEQNEAGGDEDCEESRQRGSDIRGRHSVLMEAAPSWNWLAG